jgi:hypothetical protein
VSNCQTKGEEDRQVKDDADSGGRLPDDVQDIYIDIAGMAHPMASASILTALMILPSE